MIATPLVRLRRYSGIFRIHPVQEIVEIKGLRFAALFSFDQRLTDSVDFKAPPLLTPDKITDRFTVIGI